MYQNSSIKCDVTKCRHNAEGCSCNLQSIKVGCADSCDSKPTCCESYCEK